MRIYRPLLLAPLAAAFVIAATLPAFSQTSGLKRLTLREELLGWEAVGRLEIGETGFCSGVLVAPDLVLTAAHCLANHQGQLADINNLRFRAGLRDGQSVAERGAVSAVMHRGYKPGFGVTRENVMTDAALVKLDTPIAAATAAPFAVGTTADGTLSVVSYGVGREDALSRQAECQLLGREAGLLAFNCDVTFGSSGAPVFDVGRGRSRIVSLVSSGSRDGDEVTAFGPDLTLALAVLKRQLRSGEGVFPKPDFTARRITVGSGARTGSTAKFVRP